MITVENTEERPRGSKCRECGAAITFGPHPQNPDRLAPFDSDGEIHFARCPSRAKKKRSFTSADEILCDQCEALPIIVFRKPIKGGLHRLAILCMGGHVRQIPMTPANFELINASASQVDQLLEFKRLEWGHESGFSSDPAEIRRRARRLLALYKEQYGVDDDLREFTGGPSAWWRRPT